MLVTRNVKIMELGKEILLYETAEGANINRDAVGLVKGLSFPPPCQFDRRALMIILIWFGSALQLEKKWSWVLEKFAAVVNL